MKEPKYCVGKRPRRGLLWEQGHETKLESIIGPEILKPPHSRPLVLTQCNDLIEFDV